MSVLARKLLDNSGTWKVFYGKVVSCLVYKYFRTSKAVVFGIPFRRVSVFVFSFLEYVCFLTSLLERSEDFLKADSQSCVSPCFLNGLLLSVRVLDLYQDLFFVYFGVNDLVVQK